MRTARDRAGLTQEQLAERLHVTLRTVGNWERTSVPDNRVHRVRDVLGEYLAHDHPDAASLRTASDVELLAEIARRFARQQREVGEEHADGSATNKQPTRGGDNLGTVSPFRKLDPWENDIAAREDPRVEKNRPGSD